MHVVGPPRRVVVTGWGVVSPLGPTAESTFQAAAAGRSGIRALTAFDPTGLPCRIGGQVTDADVAPLDPVLDPPARLLSRGVRFMLTAAAAAVAQAKLAGAADPARIAMVLGSHGENPTLADVLRRHRYTNGAGQWDMAGLARERVGDPFALLRRKPDMAAALVAARFGLRGANLSICSACAAGAQAVGEAYRLIREGRADAALAGGCESALNFIGFVGFQLLKAMAEKYKSPETASRPFDRRRCGFVMSEGAGALVLETLEGARARGAAILGEILGYGDSADAYRITDTHPEAEGAILAMRGALADAGVPPDAVEYVNAHGTSTAVNDVTETRAIKAVLGERARTVPVSSNKSMLGHTIGAAGAIEAILALMGMRAGLVLPTINYEYPDPKCDLDYVPNVARPLTHRVTLSNSFGFGGQNACLCLGRGDD
jgi:3-oxoacyl-[acyl-carrier-protein] synthase II